MTQSRFRSWRAMWARLARSIADITAGGSWAQSFPQPVQRNLRNFWFDGFFAAGSDNIILTYLVLYLLALGATGSQIGLLSALSSLSAALVLLPGAALVERLGRRKSIILIAGGGVARGAILLLIFLPLLKSQAAMVYTGIALSVLRDAAAYLSLPAWVSLTAAIIPLSWRGRYFASRNIAMGLAGMLIIYLMGELITRTAQPLGYQIALGIAFVLGLLSTFSFARIQESPALPAEGGESLTLKALLKTLGAQPGFLALCLTAALWNFSLNVAGPFFNVYLVQGLQANAAVVGLVTIVSSLSGLPAQRFFGSLADRWGPRRVQLVTGLVIPVLPLAWVFITAPWQVIPVNILGGILWAGFSLAAFNFMLAYTPADQRARYTAIYQLIVMVALAAGAAVGSQIVSLWGYRAVFLCSAIGRLAAALLFARLVPQPSHLTPDLNSAVEPV
jgi:MFS family permease